MSEFFVQNCLFPRLMMSPDDALYSIRFLKMLVDIKVPKINVLNILQGIMQAVISSVHSCTHNEAENIGVFLIEWFQLVDRWTDKKIWLQECATYSGFSMTLGGDDIIDFDMYTKKYCFNMYSKICTHLCQCLQNPKNPTKIQSTLKILNRILKEVKVFPKQNRHIE